MTGVQLSHLCSILPICYIFVIISMCTFPCFCSAEEKVFVTMVTHRPRFTSSQKPFYYCYVNSPDMDVTVSTRRVISTRENGFRTNRNPQPPDPEAVPSAVSSGTSIYEINLNFDENYEFGTYACDAIWEYGRTEYTTSVSNIIMLSSGNIYPASSLVTKTVNVGDRNVNIEMYLDNTVRRVSEYYLEWRHDSSIIHGAGSSGTYSFSGAIQESDEGVYICYESYRWSSAFHGMQRLIVRGCQANRWGPPLCNGICDNCYHGGVCDDESGRCICPPGFMGPNCLEACGRNRFGYNCEFTCGTLDSDYSCSQRQFCLVDPYGCSCSTGLTGLNCYTACAQGTFGANCLQECHCQNCNDFTGECPGTCEQGWSGQSCQIRDICPNDYYGSECVEKCHCKDNSPCEKETGECPNQECHPGYTAYHGSVSCQECQEGYFGDLCREECHCEASSCDKVTGGCNGQCKPQWILTLTNCQTGLVNSESAKVNPNTAAQVSCTAEGTSYSLDFYGHFLSRSQDVQDRSNIIALSASSTDVDRIERRTTPFRISDVTTEEQFFCQLTYGTTIYAFLPVTVYVYDLPELTYPPEQVSMNSSEVTISWIAWDSERDVGDPPVVSYIPYYKQNSSDEWISGTTVDSEETLEFRVADLETDTSYMFAVAAVREGSGGEGPRGPFLMVKTLCDVEPSTPVEVTASLTTKNQVRVTWRLTEEIMCSTGISSFSVYYVTEGSSKEQKFVTMVSADLMETIIESIDLGNGSHTFYVTFTTDVESTLNIQRDKSSKATVYLKPQDTSSAPVYLILLIIISVLLIVVMVFSIVRYRTKNSSNGKKTEKEEYGEDADTEYVNAAVDPEDYIPLERQPKTVLSSEYEDLHHKSEGGVSMPFLYERNIVPEPQKPVTTPRIQTRYSKGINNDAYEDVGVSSRNRQLPDVPQSHPSGDEDEDNTYEVPDRLEEYTGVYVTIKNKKLLCPGPIKVTEFQKFMSRNKEDVVKDIVHQFMALPSGKQHPWSIALEFQNKPRNLFKTVLPYDHSRVKLHTAGSDARSDYINASYIKNHQGKESFIAAQGPHQSTVDDFWMMVWQENVETIVMVTDTPEGNKPLCSSYWPSKVHMGEVCGDITVILMEYTSYSTHTIRKLNLLKGNHNPEVHTVYQLQVHSWPYGGVPKVPSFISIIKKVKTWHTDGRSSPLLVHCSNGVGATGTFIAAYVLMDVIKENKDVNIFDFVKRMRDDRVDMVQNRIQYFIIFEFLLAVLQSTDSEVSCDQLKKLGHAGIKLKSEKEFKVLQESIVEERQRENNVGNSPENQPKNRFNHIIPGDKVRPVLKSQGNTIGSSSYINAFHLAAFAGTEFIMTQTPLASTVEDFWRLVYDYDCRKIVMLNDVGGSDEKWGWSECCVRHCKD